MAQVEQGKQGLRIFTKKQNEIFLHREFSSNTGNFKVLKIKVILDCGKML